MGSGCSNHAELKHPVRLLHGDATRGELSFTEVVGPTITGPLWGGPAAATSLDELRAKAVATEAGPGHFRCTSSGPCLPGTFAPAGSLLLVMTPVMMSCDIPTAYDVRLTGAHALTATVDCDAHCGGFGTAAYGSAALLSVPLGQLPPGELTVTAPRRWRRDQDNDSHRPCQLGGHRPGPTRPAGPAPRRPKAGVHQHTTPSRSPRRRCWVAGTETAASSPPSSWRPREDKRQRVARPPESCAYGALTN